MLPILLLKKYIICLYALYYTFENMCTKYVKKLHDDQLSNTHESLTNNVRNYNIGKRTILNFTQNIAIDPYPLCMSQNSQKNTACNKYTRIFLLQKYYFYNIIIETIPVQFSRASNSNVVICVLVNKTVKTNRYKIEFAC